jgi:hypothetical protein
MGQTCSVNKSGTVSDLGIGIILTWGVLRCIGCKCLFLDQKQA